MSEKQFSINRYNEDEERKTIVVEHNDDFSEWSVDGGNSRYHSSGIGYKGNTPKQKIEILIQEIRDELKDKGFVNVELEYR